MLRASRCQTDWVRWRDCGEAWARNFQTRVSAIADFACGRKRKKKALLLSPRCVLSRPERLATRRIFPQRRHAIDHLAGSAAKRTSGKVGEGQQLTLGFGILVGAGCAVRVKMNAAGYLNLDVR